MPFDVRPDSGGICGRFQLMYKVGGLAKVQSVNCLKSTKVRTYSLSADLRVAVKAEVHN